jgi:hypothetical protein
MENTFGAHLYGTVLCIVLYLAFPLTGSLVTADLPFGSLTVHCIYTRFTHGGTKPHNKG